MKIYIWLLCLVSYVAQAQKNVFHDRNFWKENPSIETIEKLIAEGNDISSLNANAFDAVTYALIEKADNTTIKHLLSKKGNGVNKLTHDGRTYIFWAAYKDNLEMMEFLINKGAKTDIVDSHGYSVFNFAASTGQKNKKIYEFLMTHGANPALEKNHSGANALLLVAPFLNNFELLDYLVSIGLSTDSVDNDGNGVFNYAAKGGNISFLQQLIDKGYAYKTATKNGGNAFIMASQGRRGHTNALEVYKFLERIGLNPNVEDKAGKTPLHNIAYRNSDQATLNYFIKKGVDVNSQDKDGNTPFMNAARSNSLDIIKLMHPYVKDINAKNKDGLSALSKAFNRNSVEVVAFLLNQNADITVKDKHGNNLSYYLLNSFSSKNPKPFELKLNLLKKHKVPLDIAQANGNTLLHIAVQKENLELIKRIEDFNIDVNAKNNEGNTALHIAAMKAKDTRILNYLIDIGADKKLKTDFDESALDLAAENEILIQQNIDLQFLK